MSDMEDSDYDDWVEGFCMIPFTEAELEQIKSGQRTITDVDRRDLVREILHMRWLALELLKRCKELGDDEESNALIKIAAFNLLSGPRSQHEPN